MSNLEIARRMYRPNFSIGDRVGLEIFAAHLGAIDLRVVTAERAHAEVRAADHSLWCLDRLRDQLLEVADRDRRLDAQERIDMLAVRRPRVRFARLMIDVHWRSRFEYGAREWRRQRAADRARAAERGEQMTAADADE